MLHKLFLYGLVIIATTAISVVAIPDYDTLLAKIRLKYTNQDYDIIIAWRDLVTSHGVKNDLQQLEAVNSFFNRRINFSDDAKVWNQKDYWASPVETMMKRQGDCEDFSIAKYMTLLHLGIPIQKLRLIYVKAKLTANTSQAHMVLAYYEHPSAEPLVLDNINFEILPASQRRDLVPVFSFNSQGLWLGGSSTSKVNKPESRLSHWGSVLLKMQEEGFYSNSKDDNPDET